MNLEFSNIIGFKNKEVVLPEAPFLNYKPDFAALDSLWAQFGAFKNIILIGHGGSVTSFMGMYGSLIGDVTHTQSFSHSFVHSDSLKKDVHVVSTVDPEYIINLKSLPKHETLVIAISKSGETVTQIEILMHFIDYPLLIVTGEGSTLEQIGKKANAKLLKHPAIGGRYTAFTEVALVPAAVCGLDIKKMYEGAQRFYAQYLNDNIAMQAAQIFYHLEQKGYVDVFMPFYSHYLFAFNNLITQLCHESFGKNNIGQTYLGLEAPESQHHTNQRFFGGRNNMAGFFIKLGNYRQDTETIVPAGMQGIPIKDGSLAIINKLPLSFSMRSEFKGTWEDAVIHSIPVVSLSLNHINPEEVGSFIAFWQLYAVYSSVLRDTDPFDQPQVESSKKISWMKRKDYTS